MVPGQGDCRLSHNCGHCRGVRGDSVFSCESADEVGDGSCLKLWARAEITRVHDALGSLGDAAVAAQCIGLRCDRSVPALLGCALRSLSAQGWGVNLGTRGPFYLRLSCTVAERRVDVA
jgi:hypothetical protein